MAKSLPKVLSGDSQVVANFHPKRYPSQKFTEIYRPEITMSLWSDRYQEWQRVSVLIDTGADYTVLPRYVAVLLGLELAAYTVSKTTGVGGSQRVFFVPELPVKIGDADRNIPVGFIDSNDVPPLLGRQAALETFTLVSRQTSADILCRVRSLYLARKGLL